MGETDSHTTWLKRTALILILGLGAAASETVRVPGDYATIQEGLDATSAGDTVLVAAGTYGGAGNTDLSFGGIDRVLRSESGAEGTVIDAADGWRGVLMSQDESRASVIEGFTFVGGGDVQGGAIRLSEADPTIRGCRFEGNGGSMGGAIDLVIGSSVALNSCVVWGGDIVENLGTTATAI